MQERRWKVGGDDGVPLCCRIPSRRLGRRCLLRGGCGAWVTKGPPASLWLLFHRTMPTVCPYNAPNRVTGRRRSHGTAVPATGSEELVKERGYIWEKAGTELRALELKHTHLYEFFYPSLSLKSQRQSALVSSLVSVTKSMPSIGGTRAGSAGTGGQGARDLKGTREVASE